MSSDEITNLFAHRICSICSDVTLTVINLGKLRALKNTFSSLVTTTVFSVDTSSELKAAINDLVDTFSTFRSETTTPSF